MVIMEFEQGEQGLPEGFSLKEVQDKLRTRIGDIPGAEKLSLSSTFGGFGRPLSIALYGTDRERLSDLTDKIREYLRSYPGVFDIQDNLSAGKEEIELVVTPLASTVGLSQSEIANQVRDSVFG